MEESHKNVVSGSHAVRFYTSFTVVNLIVYFNLKLRQREQEFTQASLLVGMRNLFCNHLSLGFVHSMDMPTVFAVQIFGFRGLK